MDALLPVENERQQVSAWGRRGGEVGETWRRHEEEISKRFGLIRFKPNSLVLRTVCLISGVWVAHTAYSMIPWNMIESERSAILAPKSRDPTNFLKKYRASMLIIIIIVCSFIKFFKWVFISYVYWLFFFKENIIYGYFNVYFYVNSIRNLYLEINETLYNIAFSVKRKIKASQIFEISINLIKAWLNQFYIIENLFLKLKFYIIFNENNEKRYEILDQSTIRA